MLFRINKNHTMGKRVSIFTITYNSSATIEETIRSVISQNYENIEYHIIDGGSTDRTLEIINEFKDNIDSLISEPDDGIYDAFNKGLELCTGDYIQIVNSDDILDKDKISNCVEYMEKHPEIDIVQGELRMFHDAPKDYYEIRKGRNPNFWNKFSMIGLCHPTYFVKSEVYDVIKFRPYRIGMDFDWTLRALAQGYRFETIKGNIVYMKDDGTSNQDFTKSTCEEYNVAIANGIPKWQAFLYLIYTIFKKRVFLLLRPIVPINLLYIFKSKKEYIAKHDNNSTS